VQLETRGSNGSLGNTIRWMICITYYFFPLTFS
jgi:hypothetical protein